MENTEKESLEKVETVEKQKKVTNRGKTQAQAQNLEKGRAKRAENIALKKELKIIEAKKAILSSDKDYIDFQKSKIQPELKPKLTKKVITPVEPDSSSSDEEIIVKRIKKKPKKKVIHLQDFNETTDEDDDVDKDDTPPAKISNQTRNFKTTQNKKSIVKVSNESYNANNYFC